LEKDRHQQKQDFIDEPIREILAKAYALILSPDWLGNKAVDKKSPASEQAQLTNKPSSKRVVSE
jgi:hypothetical protein